MQLIQQRADEGAQATARRVFQKSYRLCEELGRGTYATVLRATREKDGVCFAMKSQKRQDFPAAANECTILATLGGNVRTLVRTAAVP